MDRNAVYIALAEVAHDRETLYRKLRSLPTDVVADVLFHIPPEYSELRAALPAMASEETQIQWTGASGYPLLFQTCAIARAMENGLYRFANKRLDGARVLDFGCGWGRLIRLMYRFTDPSEIYGCDPWDKSLELCKQAGLRANLAQSDYLPSALPFEDGNFDFIYAFSVFTHLSERAASAAMAACRKSIKSDGIMMVTIRPLSYWEYHHANINPIDVSRLHADHHEKGIAFRPHKRESVDGDITYGDTSISLDYIQRNWTEWEVIGQDVLLQDAYQTMVFLRPK
ncbi:class I SAM-dependent methyltransferase [Bordetella genomosp. 11]|uniref:Methyltransferase domain-containing protein n=1 Tax=Bordetella genomosp. 11 TaxID=1416808 RepID=A0A261UM58_9BORD|nr:class I SAM-dependent methyltransferase [Bordetella genomosp. 11]OZI62966.1 hypothetical protein CAL28_28030 [Bordetella genomosp. 11]